MTRNNNISGSWIFGIALMIIGALLFLEKTDIFFTNFYLPWWVFSWHSFLVILGLIIIATTNNRTPGFFLIGIGILTLLPHWWPLLLIVLGILLLTRGSRSNFTFSSMNSASAGDPDRIEVVTVFGGCNKFFQSENFKGGTIFAAFGGSEINLYGCKLAEGVNYIDVTAIFGGSSIQAPSDWNIQLEITPIFGGAGDKRIKSPNMVYDPNRVLVIKGSTIFGGIDIKN